MAAKYIDTITDRAGNALAGASVQVVDQGGALVTLYSDPDLLVPIGTSASADYNGLIQFYVPDGTYTIRQSYAGTATSIQNVELFSLSDIKDASDQSAATKANAAAIGVAPNASNLGTFTGDIIPDNSTAKQALQALSDAQEGSVAALASPTGSYLMRHRLRTAHERLDDWVALHDYLHEGDEGDAAAVNDALAQALETAEERGREVRFTNAATYAQPDTTITLNNVVISAPKLSRPPYMPISGYAALIEQIDNSRPIFRIGKNVTLSGLTMIDPSLTNANALEAIADASAVTPAEIRAALEAIWGDAAPLLVGQTGDTMSMITLEDITVPACWNFMRFGDTASGEVAGAINIVRPRIFSVHRDFIGVSSAEANNVTGGFFSFGVAPDMFVADPSPLRDYCVNYGAFLEVDSADAAYDSFDGFNVDNSVIFGKRFALLAASGALSVSRWRNIHTDALSHAIYIENAGRILSSSFEFDSYSYKFPVQDDDDEYAGRAVIFCAPTAAASTGYSSFSIRLKSDYSSGPVLTVTGDQQITIDIDDMVARDFGAESFDTPVSALNIGNPNAVVRADGMRIKALDGQTVHSGLSVDAGRFESVGAKFENCKYSAAQTGGVLVLDSPTSINTATADITRSGGSMDIRDPRWSKPVGLQGYPSFRAFADAQSFTGAATIKTFPTINYDMHGDFANNAFTAPFAGQYQFNILLLHDNAGTAGDRWLIELCRNAVAQGRTSYKMIGDYNSVALSITCPAGAGDVFDVRVSRMSGSGNFNVLADGNSCFFIGRRVA